MFIFVFFLLKTLSQYSQLQGTEKQNEQKYTGAFQQLKHR